MFNVSTSGAAISINNGNEFRLRLKFENGKFEINTTGGSKEMTQINVLKNHTRTFLTKLSDKKKSYSQRMADLNKIFLKYTDSKTLKVFNNRIEKELTSIG